MEECVGMTLPHVYVQFKHYEYFLNDRFLNYFNNRYMEPLPADQTPSDNLRTI